MGGLPMVVALLVLREVKGMVVVESAERAMRAASVATLAVAPKWSP